LLQFRNDRDRALVAYLGPGQKGDGWVVVFAFALIAAVNAVLMGGLIMLALMAAIIIAVFFGAAMLALIASIVTVVVGGGMVGLLALIAAWLICVLFMKGKHSPPTA
jgi:hypothetical protein